MIEPACADCQEAEGDSLRRLSVLSERQAFRDDGRVTGMADGGQSGTETEGIGWQAHC